MSLVSGGVIILIILVYVAMIGYLFYESSKKWGFWGVFSTLIGVIILIGTVILTIYVTVNFGDIECNYIPEVRELNETTNEYYNLQEPHHECHFNFLGTKSTTEKFYLLQNVE